MPELLTFVELGLRHITDVDGADHILFLLVLAAVYRLREWREGLLVVTAFTVGHSITLVLAVMGVLRLPSTLIEFLIPVTIVATGIENVVVRERGSALWGGRYRVVFAGVFGLVHGAGFANYLRALFVDRVALPLVGFNVGIEVGQVIVLVAAGLLFALVDAALAPLRRPGGWAPTRMRTVAVSAVVTLIAARWAAERSPW